MKKSVGIMIVMLMLVTTFMSPITVFASTGYDLWVNGEQFTSDKTSIACGSGTATFDVDTNTLTLVNATIDKYIQDGWDYYSIRSKLPNLTIDLVGNNTIDGKNNADGINAAGGSNVIIKGSGTLTMNNAYYGIYIGYYDTPGGDLKIENTTVTVNESYAAGIWVNHDINFVNSDVTINRTRDDGYSGIVSNKDGTITVNGGLIKVDNKKQAILLGNGDSSAHKLIVNSGKLDLTSTGFYGIYFQPVIGPEGEETNAVNGKIEINGGIVDITSNSGGTNIPESDITLSNEMEYYEENTNFSSTGNILIKKSYTLTLDLNGGTMTGTNPVTVDDGAKVTRPTTDPIKDGYVFAGWYADAGLTQEFDFDNTTITADTTIYAKWNQVTTTTYTVTFDLNGGTRKEGLEAVTTDATVTDGAEMSLNSYIPLAVNAPEGKVFDAIEINGTRYELDNSTYTIHSNVNIKFLWKDPYKITLNINGGTPNDASMELEEVIPSIITLTNPLVLTLNDTNLGKANPPTGKAFSHYEIDGTEYAIGDEYIIYNNKNVTIKWIWEDIHEETLIITGDNQTFTLGNTNDITITCSGALNDLTAIKVNGVELEEANRELISGSTVLTLKNSYLNTLSVGTYTVTFEYGANSKAATLNVAEATNSDDNNNNNNTNDNTNNNTNNNTSNNPQTSYNVVDYVYTLIIGIICLAGGTVYLKRKELFGNR